MYSQKLAVVTDFGMFTFRFLEDASDFVNDFCCRVGEKGYEAWNRMVNEGSVLWPLGVYEGHEPDFEEKDYSILSVE